MESSDEWTRDTFQAALAKAHGHGGTAQWDFVRPCLESVVQRSWEAGYHYRRAMRLWRTDQALAERLGGPRAVLGLSMEQRQQRAHRMRPINMHLVGCVHALRARVDSLAHVVFLSLGLDGTHADVEPRLTADGLPSLLERVAQWKPLSEKLRELNDGGDASYVRHVDNASKHRSVVSAEPTLALSPAWDNRFGLAFQGFRRILKEGPQWLGHVWVEDLLPAEMRRQDVLVREIGNMVVDLLNDGAVAT